ncbi:phosphoribosyl-AMP cyclohydrolase [Dasania sp. GY-MA-18]|uniref:Phosphoribosyl-AMP cyclohydrolase n=1 Tax=Dasania phycosphaerae TaxID=2950436 RepID=A0A9J6RKI7_9GAMM|nr:MULTISPECIES: phosphoribosyl-AMP cyclohydrolase [Dasania]MCR8922429.1 phosphoribosyl-AMP cyclohydrolase [Dasania sp. GY-MA-18]MCZ0864857.1 phosphoribosyl-AMP cyclohydrolase [Dasania phycosphaerae]MCZ0868585.1 phosphoribosyl-AMP cyclohydrolase [Dasania phycosphaerae]
MKPHNDFLEALRWDSNGLIPVIAQDHQSNDVLMVAWMNREALALTVAENRAVYWSRSRQKLWRKGEESGHVQQVHEIRLDCDEDVLILKIEQVGGIACHTGRRSCFYRKLIDGQWQSVEAVIKDPSDIYQ